MHKDLSLVHVVRAAINEGNPAGHRPPLLLLLHGVGANERQMATLAPEFDPRFVVVSARSPIVIGPNAFAWFHVTFGSDGPVIDEDQARAGWAMVADFAKEAVETYGADPDQVYLAGFSQGGIMSLAAILTTPTDFAGAVCMSGRLLPEVLPFAAEPAVLGGKPILLVHGEHDTKLGVHFARWARQRLQALPVHLDYHELPMAHEITRESLGIVTSWLSAQIDKSESVRQETAKGKRR